jgi:D-sedoheptulose 7-phosphate isomerase
LNIQFINGDFLDNQEHLFMSTENIISILRESAKLKLQMVDQVDLIQKIALTLEKSLRSGNKIILFGNGGSAADAQHIAAELMGKFYLNRSPLPVMALTTNSSVLTAVSNDYSYSLVFSRQVEAWALPGDVVVGISTSGKSKNVLEAFRVARSKGALTVGFCGQDDQPMTELTDLCLSVPSIDTPRIQEIHLAVGHILCYLVEQALFGYSQ